MKSKILNLLLIVTSLMGYLQWGAGQKAFLFQVEAEIIAKLFTQPAAVLHPFTVLPMAGQLLLLTTLFQKQPGRRLTYSGMICLGILPLFMFVIGILSLNYKILASTLPFIILAGLTLRHYRKINPQ